jgi:hypothetical protein
MALRILGSKTVEKDVSDTEQLILGPFKKARTVRLMADVMLFVHVVADGESLDGNHGYPICDLAYEDIEVPGGHYLLILGAEPGKVWLTEFAHG